MRVLVQNAELPNKKNWFHLPIGKPDEHMDETHRFIRISRKPGGYLASLLIADVESEIPNLKIYVQLNTSLEKLDGLSVELSTMTEKEKQQFADKLNKEKPKAIEDMITFAKEITTSTMAFCMNGGM